MLSLLLATILSATPQEHQVENVINPKAVEISRLDRGNHTTEVKLRPVLQSERNVTLIVPNDADGLVKLGNTLKSKDRLKTVSVSPNRKFSVYLVPFEDLQDAAKLKELAKENKTVQMYPTFIDPPFAINGKVLVNVKLLEKDRLKDFVEKHKLVMESIVENNIFGTYFVQITDASDLLDVFALLEAIEKEAWVNRVALDLPVVPLR
jgi:hypothetical protein